MVKQIAAAVGALVLVGILVVVLRGVEMTIALDRAQLQEKVDEGIQSEYSLAKLPATVKLHERTVVFDESGSRLGVRFELELVRTGGGALPGGGPPGPPGGGPPFGPRKKRAAAGPGSMAKPPTRIDITVYGKLRYAAEESALYCHDLTLVSTSIQEAPAPFQGPIKTLVLRLVTEALCRKPLHTLEDGAARMLLQDVRVEGERLLIVLKAGG